MHSNLLFALVTYILIYECLKVAKIILSSIFIWNKLDALCYVNETKCEIVCFTSLEGVTWYSCNSRAMYIYTVA